MCDFHSVIVTGDGKILHKPSNSHSDIQRHHNLPVGLDGKWWECEWNGEGDMPVQLVQTRGKETEPTGLAQRAADAHYIKLAKIMAGDLDPTTTAPFDGPDYVDVRQRYEAKVIVPQLSEKLFGALGDLPTETVVAVIREFAKQQSVEMEDIAKDEIQTAREEGYDSGREDSDEGEYERGYEAASEELFTQEYMDEEIERAVKDMHDDDALEVAKQEAYEAGFLACKAGAQPAVEYINGLPAFLFTK